MNTYQKSLHMAFRLIDGLNHDCQEYELRQKANWAFGAGLLASALSEHNTSLLMYDLDAGLADIASKFTNSTDAIRAAQELKARLEQAHG